MWLQGTGLQHSEFRIPDDLPTSMAFHPHARMLVVRVGVALLLTTLSVDVLADWPVGFRAERFAYLTLLPRNWW